MASHIVSSSEKTFSASSLPPLQLPASMSHQGSLSGLNSAASTPRESLSSLSPRQWQTKLDAVSDDINKEIRQILESNLRNLQAGSFCIATTGSDARREKISSLSPVELLVIFDEPRSASSTPALDSPRASLEATLYKIGAQFSAKIDQRFQFQDLSTNPLTYHATTLSGGSVHLTIPNRAVETTLLYGSEEVMDKFQALTLQSLQKFNHQKFVHFDKQFCKPARTALEQCLSREDKTAVNLDTGELHFDNDKIKSVKYVLMRVVQYELMKHLITAVKAGFNPENFHAEMPPRIADRIIWMQKNDLLPLSPEEADHLSSAYTKALEWYLNSQNAFEHGEPTTKVDVKELNGITATIQAFADKSSKKESKQRPALAAPHRKSTM